VVLLFCPYYTLDYLVQKMATHLLAETGKIAVNWDKLPSTAVSARTINRVSAKLGLHAEGLSYRLIARNLGLSKNTVMDIVKRGASPSALQKMTHF
jgi:hypothetical protein